LKAHIFFPASKFDFELLKCGTDKATKLGLNVTCPEPPEPQWFQCAKPSTRLQSFLDALHGSAEIIWGARGGFGTAQWLSQLPHDKNLWKGKRLVGFSDLTALHAWTSNRGISSYHAPMIATKGWNEASEPELESWKKAIIHQQPQTLPISCHGSKQLESGKLIGGNLTVLASLMGTPHQLQLNPGDILFLEDIQEPPYRLARSLFQLSHSQHFEKVQILWGQLTECGSLSVGSLIEKLMAPYLNPWAYGLDAGHGRPNHSIRLGDQVFIENSTLSFPAFK